MSREHHTLEAMLGIYCRDHHDGAKGLCAECTDLRDYAFARLMRCPFQPDKPACSKCTVHCYKPEMRERIRQVMQYAGPRMLVRHPVLAVAHIWDKRKPAPELARNRKTESSTETSGTRRSADCSKGTKT